MYEREFIRCFNYDNDDLKNRFRKMIEIQNNMIRTNEKPMCKMDNKINERIFDAKFKVD